MKVSVITVCKNSQDTILDCVKSVRSQTHKDIEHIIIDGVSVDRTYEVVLSGSPDAVFISELDDGLYDAMNKGLRRASGEIVCFLNSDDYLKSEEVIENIALSFRNPSVAVCSAGIEMINDRGRVVRKWSVTNGSFSVPICQAQLPHPGLFFRRSTLMKYPVAFDTQFSIVADLHLQLRLVRDHISRFKFIDITAVTMRLGGKSTASLGSHLNGWFEARNAWNDVHGCGGAFFVFQKVIRKMFQFWS